MIQHNHIRSILLSFLLVLTCLTARAQPSFIRHYTESLYFPTLYLTDFAEHPDSGFFGLWRKGYHGQGDSAQVGISHFMPNGDLLQSKRMDFWPQVGTQYRNFLEVSPSGAVYFSSNYVSGDTIHALIAEIDPHNCEPIWAKAYGWADHRSGLERMEPMANGDLLLVCGRANYNGILDSLFYHPMIMRLDSAGNLKWHKQPILQWTSVKDVVEMPNGDLLVAGSGVPEGLGTGATFLFHLDSNGVTKSVRSYSDSILRLDPQGMHIWSNGNIGILGGMWSDTSNILYEYTGMIVADTAGNLISGTLYEGFQSGSNEGLQIESDLVIAGYTRDWGVDSSQAALYKIDSLGAPLWSRYYDEDFMVDSAIIGSSNAILALDDGGFLLGGINHGDSVFNHWSTYLMSVDSAGNNGCNSFASTPVTLPFNVQIASITPTDTLIPIQAYSIPWTTDSLEFTDTYACISECVWPGDTDNDGLANNFDLLPIGLAYGFLGPNRYNPSNNWTCQNAANWGDQFLSGANHKHADCNGDGIVNEADTMAIHLNYGLFHPRLNGASAGSASQPPLLLHIPQDTAYVGDTIHAPILLGSPQFPLDSIYGIAFRLLYDKGLVDSATAWISYDSSWFGDNSNTLHMSRDFWTEGFIDGAITRIDHQNTQGYSQIATLHFILIDNIEGKREAVEILHMDMGLSMGLTSGARTVEVEQVGDSLVVLDPEIAVGAAQDPRERIWLYPNPASELLNIAADENPILELEVYTLEGKSLLKMQPRSKQVQLNLGRLPPGMYILKASTRKGVANRRFTRK